MLGGGGLNFPFDTYYEGKLKSSPGYVAGQALGNLDLGKLIGLSTIAKALSAQRGTPVSGPATAGVNGVVAPAAATPQASGMGGMGNDMILPMLMMDPQGGMGVLSKFLDPSVQSTIAFQNTEADKNRMQMNGGLPHEQAALAEATRAHKESEELRGLIAGGQLDARKREIELTNENRRTALEQARNQFIANLHTKHPIAAWMPWSATSHELKKLESQSAPSWTPEDEARLNLLKRAKGK